MKILIAEDDQISRRVLEHTLTNWGYRVVSVCDGNETIAAFEAENAPNFAILDWMMPVISGVDVCRIVRKMKHPVPPYIIMLTTKDNTEDVIEGLEAGADDYVTKPFNRGELRARIKVGETVLNLQKSLVERIGQLETALAEVQQLQQILPICSYCKNIRDDHDFWQSVDSYMSEHSDMKFSHGICPGCYESVVKPQLEVFKRSL